MQKKIFIRKKNGNRICGILHTPKKKLSPAIILCHGLTSNKGNKEKMAEFLKNEGFYVFRFDAIGNGESDGDFFDFTISGYVEDARYVVDHLSRNKSITSIGMSGHSLGGMVSIITGSKDRRVKSVVSISSPSDMEKARGKDSPFKPDFVRKWKEKGYITLFRKFKTYKLGYGFIEDARKYNASLSAKKLKNILVIHGDSDSLVLPKHAKAIYRNAKKPKKLIIIEGMGHSVGKEEPQVTKYMLEWFKKHL